MKIGSCPVCGDKITKKTVNGVLLIDKPKFRQIRVVYNVAEDEGMDPEKNNIHHELQGPICSKCVEGISAEKYEDAMKKDPPVEAMMKRYPHRLVVSVGIMRPNT